MKRFNTVIGSFIHCWNHQGKSHCWRNSWDPTPTHMKSYLSRHSKYWVINSFIHTRRNYYWSSNWNSYQGIACSANWERNI